MEDLLSQDDLNALLGGSTESTINVPGKETSGLEDLLSQDDLNALLNELSEEKIAFSKQEMAIPDMPVENASSGGGSMTQEEIDEMLRQFDRDI